MFRPKFQYTNDMVNDLMKIERYRSSLEYLYLPTRARQELNYNAKMKKTHFSTSIEGNVLSYEQVERVITEKNKETKINAERELLNYWDALSYLETEQKKQIEISVDFIKRLHGEITKKAGKPKKSNFREEMPPGVLFAVYDNNTKMPEYIPPEWSDIEELMQDLLEWYKEESELPLPVKVAIFHYQFVTIHPFIDGNGRTARALATYILMQNDYDFKACNSMEEYYATDLDGYYNNLQQGLPPLYYEGRNDPPHLEIWIEFFVHIMALNAEKIFELAVEATPKDKGNALIASLNNRDKKMLRYVLENQIELIKTKDLADVFMVTPRAITKWCKEWCERGLLIPNLKNVRVTSYSLSEKYRNLDLNELGFIKE